MALSTTHTFNLAIADDPASAAAGMVIPSLWNAANSHTLSGTASIGQGGTGLSTFNLGDTLYSSAANTLAALAGNITTTRKFLRQTGTGTVSAAPTWDTIVAADVPAPGSTGQVLFNNAGALAGITGSSVSVNASVTLGGQTITVSDPVLNLSQTWNAGTIATTGASGTGTIATITFAAQTVAPAVGSIIIVAGVTPTGYNNGAGAVVTASTTTSVSYANTTTGAQTVAGTVQSFPQGIKLNVTNTQSPTLNFNGPMLLDLQVGGAEKFNINSGGEANSWAGFTLRSTQAAGQESDFRTITSGANSFMTIGPQSGSGGGLTVNINNGNAYLPGTLSFQSAYNTAGANGDTVLARDAAGILAQRNLANAQTHRVYNTTDSGIVNYERGVFDWTTTANVLTIGTQAAGTGTVRDFSLVKGTNVFLTSVTSTVAGLPAAAAALTGARRYVTDANATFTAGIGAVVAGGGANIVPVFCDGTNWRIG